MVFEIWRCAQACLFIHCCFPNSMHIPWLAKAVTLFSDDFQGFEQGQVACSMCKCDVSSAAAGPCNATCERSAVGGDWTGSWTVSLTHACQVCRESKPSKLRQTQSVAYWTWARVWVHPGFWFLENLISWFSPPLHCISIWLKRSHYEGGPWSEIARTSTGKNRNQCT